MKQTTRHYDERLLNWLRLKTNGLSNITIAERFNVDPANVRANTNLVKNCDLAESGEDAAHVLAGYWA